MRNIFYCEDKNCNNKINIEIIDGASIIYDLNFRWVCKKCKKINISKNSIIEVK